MPTLPDDDHALDADQRAVVAAARAGGHHVVHGAPGTGKTHLALALTVQEAQGGGRPQLLVPTRVRAAELRDRATRRIGRTLAAPVVRTPAALAYAVLRLRASHRGEPAPTLISGPEQDQILTDLLAGHAEGEGPDLTWPEGIGPRTWELPAFRHELRDVLMRAAEAGLIGAEVGELGRQHARPEWVGAGQILTEYQQVMALGQLTPDRGARYDAASIVDEAVQALQTWERDVPGIERPSWTLVIHDDYQDATLATARLLGELAGNRAALALIGDADIAVQSFRGGVPALLATAAAPMGGADGAFGATDHVLTRVHRHGHEVRGAIRRLTQELPVLAAARRRDAQPESMPGTNLDSLGGALSAAEGDAGVQIAVLGSAAQEVAFVARHLRAARLLQGVPWSQMAVIARSAAHLGAIRRRLHAAGVPLAVATPDRPLREEPAVRPLLAVVDAAIHDRLDATVALELLTGPIGGLDSVSLRALRRDLRGAERDEGSRRSSADLLTELLFDPDTALQAPRRFRRATGIAARVLSAAREATHTPGATVETVLWAAWDATGLSRTWQQQALQGGPGADRADANLDAVLALFRAAEQFTDRTAHSTPGAFLEYLQAQDFPADTLAPRGQVPESVSVLTAAAAAGGQWDIVAVVGVQEDVWPDLRIRDTVLGAADLADLATARAVPGADPAARAQHARRQVADGELRAFASACSRAARSLLVTAILDDDERPSAFLDLLAGHRAERHEITTALPPLDLRGLVGQLRAALRPVLAGGGVSAEQVVRASEAAAVLTHLARQGVEGADPATWGALHGPTTKAPLFDEDDPPSLSPSAAEWLARCPLRWFLTRHGGEDRTSQAQQLGNLVHEIAAAHPDGDETAMQRVLEERWHELGLEDGWVGRAQKRRARAMVTKLARYCAGAPTHVEVERSFDVQVGAVRLRGRVDRLEYTDDGLRVVDIKTGKNAVRYADAEAHPQLATYQVAVQAGGFDDDRSAGAALVYPGTTTKDAAIRPQTPLAHAENPRWAHDMVEQLGDILMSGTFEARPNQHCPRCPVKASCPAQPEGARVGGAP